MKQIAMLLNGPIKNDNRVIKIIQTLSSKNSVHLFYIDGENELIQKYGEEVPVIHIDGKHHDIFRVDLNRFRSSLEKHRLHQ